MACLSNVGNTQPSIVTWLPVIFSEAGVPAVTNDAPSKLKALPTSPDANAGFPTHVPLLPLMMSLVLFSPGHQLIMFAGGGTQPGDAVGVDVAVAVAVGVAVA